jgi:hypothetical protein
MTGTKTAKIIARTRADFDRDWDADHRGKHPLRRFFLGFSHAVANLGESNGGIAKRHTGGHGACPHASEFCVTAAEHLNQDVGVHQNASHLELCFSRKALQLESRFPEAPEVRFPEVRFPEVRFSESRVSRSPFLRLRM